MKIAELFPLKEYPFTSTVKYLEKTADVIKRINAINSSGSVWIH